MLCLHAAIRTHTPAPSCRPPDLPSVASKLAVLEDLETSFREGEAAGVYLRYVQLRRVVCLVLLILLTGVSGISMGPVSSHSFSGAILLAAIAHASILLIVIVVFQVQTATVSVYRFVDENSPLLAWNTTPFVSYPQCAGPPPPHPSSPGVCGIHRGSVRMLSLSWHLLQHYRCTTSRVLVRGYNRRGTYPHTHTCIQGPRMPVDTHPPPTDSWLSIRQCYSAHEITDTEAKIKTQQNCATLQT